MKSSLIPTPSAALWITLIVFCSCGSPEPPTVAQADPELLTEREIRDAIQGDADFGTPESTLHLLEWQVADPAHADLWRITRTEEPDGIRVRVEILPDGESLFRSAEYYAGGVVPLELARPLARRLTEVRQVTDGDYPGLKEVEFAWEWVDVPDLLVKLKPNLLEGPFRGTARIQFQEDSWEVIGRVRDYQVKL